MLRCLLPALLIALGACGAGGENAACHRASDCGSGLGCVGPDDFLGCGRAPMEECATSADCGSGQVCDVVADSCSRTGFGSRCDLPCTQVSCGTGFACNASGACEPVRCDQGVACAAWEVCDPAGAAGTGAAYTETAGCATVACSSDHDCPAGEACVNGTCQTGAGTCMAPVAYP